jgi:hypothetical protein
MNIPLSAGKTVEGQIGKEQQQRNVPKRRNPTNCAWCMAHGVEESALRDHKKVRRI